LIDRLEGEYTFAIICSASARRGEGWFLGTLFVVATPIGNLEDISPRALRTLREVGLIAAEDTRRTLQLLRRFEIETRLISAHAFNERAREATLLAELETGDVALVTDAGTPAISDPGTLIVDAAHRAGFPVIAIPGPSSLTAALSVSGLVEGPVIFLGFPPRKTNERRAFLKHADVSGFAFVLFESSNRTADTLKSIAELDPDRLVAVSRELTKLHEETVRGTARELMDRFDAEAPRGEVVIVVQGGGVQPVTEADAALRLFELLDQGMRASDAAKQIAAESGIARSDLYQMALDRKVSRTGNPVSGGA
jgi:16S rRNA (cytidine1402-2'-O)-methyltransferase